MRVELAVLRPKGGKVMRFGKVLASSVGAVVTLGLLLLSPGAASAQTVSPCCSKLCDTAGNSIQCNEAAVGGLGAADLGGNPALVRGCVDVELGGGLNDVCYGGAILDSGVPTLLNGCLCILAGNDGGPGQCVDGMGASLTPEQCTAAAIAGCGANTTTTANDPACGSCPVNPCGDGTCDAAAGENCETCAADCACTAPDTCQAGVCTPPNACGDGTCDAAGGEDCTSCPADCGSCGQPGACRIGTGDLHCFPCNTAEPVPDRCASAGVTTCDPNDSCS
jgi:hypothetical protein